MAQFIYTMKGLGKVYPPDQVVFKDIYLSFYYGAKIGVIGSNGSGKSTLLKIMAGLDPDYLGDAILSQGYSVGYLPQEPTLDPSKTVLGNVEEGVAATKALLTRFDEINEKFAEDLSPEEMEKILEEQAKVQDATSSASSMTPSIFARPPVSTTPAAIIWSKPERRSSSYTSANSSS